MKKSVTIKAAWIMRSATVIAALIAGIFLICSKSPSQNTIEGDYVAGSKTVNIVISDPILEAKVKQTANEQRDNLNIKYPTGSAIFGVTQKGLVVPEGLVPPNSDIQWDTARILELTESSIKILLPRMTINTETNKGIRVIGQEVGLPKRVNAKWSMYVWLTKSAHSS